MEQKPISSDDIRNSFLQNAIEEGIFLQESRGISNEIKNKITKFVKNYLLKFGLEFENWEKFEGEIDNYSGEILRRLREYKNSASYVLDKKKSELVSVLKAVESPLMVLDSIFDTYLLIVYNELGVSSIDGLKSIDDNENISIIRKSIVVVVGELMIETNIDELSDKILVLLKKYFLKNTKMKTKILEKLSHLEAFAEQKQHLRLKDVVRNGGLPSSLISNLSVSSGKKGNNLSNGEIDELEYISRMLSGNEHIIDSDGNHKAFVGEDGIIYE